jgi:hypothetical protein
MRFGGKLLDVAMRTGRKLRNLNKKYEIIRKAKAIGKTALDNPESLVTGAGILAAGASIPAQVAAGGPVGVATGLATGTALAMQARSLGKDLRSQYKKNLQAERKGKKFKGVSQKDVERVRKVAEAGKRAKEIIKRPVPQPDSLAPSGRFD